MDIVAYTAVDDCGNTLDAMIVEGQLHGSLAQGFGQALMEEVFYDETGQLVSGSFQDYAMPRATDMPPDIRDALHNVPAKTNPLGVKGVGEAGTSASIAAVMNAVADALPGGAGAHLDMPVTAARLLGGLPEGESVSLAALRWSRVRRANQLRIWFGPFAASIAAGSGSSTVQTNPSGRNSRST